MDVYSDYVKTTCALHVELANASWRPILAYEVSVRAIPHYQGGVKRKMHDASGPKACSVEIEHFVSLRRIPPLPSSWLNLSVTLP